MSARGEGRRVLQDGSIDAGLLLLKVESARGFTFSNADIAFVCGCSKNYIWLLEKQAMRKLRAAFESRRLKGEI